MEINIKKFDEFNLNEAKVFKLLTPKQLDILVNYSKEISEFRVAVKRFEKVAKQIDDIYSVYIKGEMGNRRIPEDVLNILDDLAIITPTHMSIESEDFALINIVDFDDNLTYIDEINKNNIKILKKNKLI